MKKTELNDKSITELKKLEMDKIEEYRNIRFNEVLGSVNDLSQKKVIRHDIARIKTVLREYELGIRKVK
ncbi:MAG: 50S ribosomal protein L29 [Spirochaetota bacterium]|nr:50S ribosomal protein L29 [Spirochaetota bacterium]